MKRLLLGPLFIVAACNTSTTGANGNIQFTPTNCGVVAGCDFADNIGVNGKIDVQITGLNGTSTAGLDLASGDQSVLLVSTTADQNGAPAWELTAVAPGVADLSAVDGSGNEVDFVEVPVEAVDHFEAAPFAGSIVVGTPTQGFDQAFTVQGDALVSWYIRPFVVGTPPVETMGRYDFTYTSTPDLSPFETSSSDSAHGYFYVQPPQGQYAVTFAQVEDPGLSVAFSIDAQ